MELLDRKLRDAFLQNRKKGIGGSDVAAIFGLDRYRTPEDVWLEKTGQVVPADEPNADKERGIRLEPIAAELYGEKEGVRLTRVAQPMAHPDYPWMRANVDRLIINDDENMIGEIKCPSLGMFSKIKREGLPYAWTLQMQHYLCVAGLRRGIWIIFCADRWELISFEVERDELIIDRIIEKEREFWQYVETMSPPPNIVAEVQDQKIVVVGTVTKRSDEEFVEALSHLREARAVAKTGEELFEAAKARVLEIVEENPGIYEVAGVGRVNFAQRAGRTTFDKERLQNARPIDRDKLMGVLADEAVGRADGKFVLVDDLNRAAMHGALDLDLSAFEKQGKPYTDFRFYGSREE